jgi:MYXO-CTERM domain-containing protein
MKASLRASFAPLIGSVVLLLSATSLAAGEPCINDIDCPGGGDVCGGEVCNWNKPQGDKFTCNAAGTDPKKSDGWCTTTADCKCRDEGATCKIPYCTFTLAADAPPTGAGGGGSTGGNASTGGGGAATGGGGASTGTAGTTSTGTAGTASTGTAGTTSAPPPAADEGGCSVAVPAGKSSGLAFGLGLLGLGYALVRRRRAS